MAVDPREVKWTAGKLDEVAASFDASKDDQVAFVRQLMKDAADLIRRLDDARRH